MKVWLIKPSVDDRDGANAVKSRIGLYAEAYVVTPDIDLTDEYKKHNDINVIIADECQFLTPKQIDQLRSIVENATGGIVGDCQLSFAGTCQSCCRKEQPA